MNNAGHARSSGSQIDKAAAFRELHDRSGMFVLPNAWDAVSARIFEEAGFAAIGTTSAGLAASLGYPDGERVGIDEVVGATRRIVRSVALPVSVDIEAGYGEDADEVASTVAAVISAGAVGVNLEDAASEGDEPLREVSEQLERIQAAREAASSAGVEIVINARTDVYWLRVGREQELLSRAVERSNAYRDAGVDCLFVPGARESATIAELARSIDGPLNVLAGPGVPPVPELKRLGVARLSVGSGPMRATLALFKRISEELIGSGTYEAFTQDAVAYSEVNELFSRRGNRRPHV